MTSEGPHRPGQEPDEVSPGAGGPAPYGDRPAQPDNGYNATGPDLGWAPPPPTRPNPPAPAWAAQSEQQPNPAWGAAAAPQPTEPAQPAWATGGGANEPPQPPGTWTGAGGPPDHTQPAPWAAQQQGWTPAEQSAPGWTPGATEQPEWAQAQPAARGAAQVPPATAAWPAQDDPSRSGGWNADAQQDDPARSGAWGGAAQANPPAGDWRGGEPQQSESAQAAGWSGGGSGQQDDQAGSAGWANGTAGQADQPVWTPAEQSPQTWGQAAESTEQPAPGWGQAEPAAARGAAQVPAQAPAPNWPSQDDPARSGGWAGQQQPAQPSGWGDGTDVKQDEAAQPAAWGGAEGRPQQPDWVLASQDQPAERPEPAEWTPEGTATPARASASVPSNDGTPAWAAAPDNAAQGGAGVPEAQPWAPGEVWGRAEAEASQSRGDWETGRGDESPVYQPAPAPGISPANAVPLPPQEQRVPGASLAAAPPANYGPPAQYGPASEQPAYAERDSPDAAAQYEAEPAGWGRAEEAPAAGAVVPAPRTSPEAGAGRAVVPTPDAESAAGAAGRASASASVPLASRVMPPTDQAVRPAGAPAPQPRVYGRPSRPEPDNEPEQAAPEAFQTDPGPERQSAPDWQNGPDRRAAPDWQNGPERQGAPAWGGEAPAEPRFDDRDVPAAPNGFAEAASPPPAFPPGVPSFVDTPGSNRPVNGVRPQAGAERPADPFGAPGSPAAGTAAVNGTPGFGGPSFGGPGFGGPANEPAPGGGFPPAFPPAPQQLAPSWGQQAGESDQGRFDAFKPDADQPKVEPPTPKVRNGRVLAAVLIAAVLILAVPLGLLMLLGKFGGDDTPAFDPAVGTCVKQSGQGASAVDCGEAGAFTIVSKVDAKDKCADPAQPHVVLPGDGINRVLCLKPATK
ncbi:hypothetical protein GA0070607_2455 [Micromonospora coriariae]|uniref:Uncharacterized protein n=1 Tax=Micromonospora coriariae TaxID=285665 RepID=A0A1C4VPM4_9ACTN|nr:hypothetical protein [Micromonospora coriariae]SCE85936.1 hypothetical protein GA0070607_2455 [Micromonospora coriariae]